MQIFAGSREAKEFLVQTISEEARREGEPLSVVEEQMLYFTETGWAPSNIDDISEAFDRDYDQDDYEKRIAALIRNFRTRAKQTDATALAAWVRALQTIGREDHYILALISIADGAPTTASSASTPEHRSIWKLILIACLWGIPVLAITAAVLYFTNR